MRSNSSTSLACSRSLASVRLHSPTSCCSVHLCEFLDTAVEHLMVKKDFTSALETCEKALENLGTFGENEERCSRCGELKTALCIVGIQALAELNLWRGSLEWVLRQYGETENIPAKLIQMCILLYTKVGEQQSVQEAVSIWLHCPSNVHQAGFSTVAELYLLHVLLPLDQTTEALKMVEGGVGSVAFTGEQRKAALDIVENHRLKQKAPPDPDQDPGPSSAPEPTCLANSTTTPPQGAFVQRMNAVLRLLNRGLSLVSSRSRSFPLCKLLAVLLLLYLLLMRMDPALPASFPWILQLLKVLRETWSAMFGPFHRASTQK